MFNYKKVDNLQEQLDNLKITNCNLEKDERHRDNEIIRLQNKVKAIEAEKVSKYNALLYLVDRYVKTIDYPIESVYSPSSGGILLSALGSEYVFEREIERRERDKINRAERSKIEAIVRDLLKKNVFKDVKE